MIKNIYTIIVNFISTDFGIGFSTGVLAMLMINLIILIIYGAKEADDTIKRQEIKIIKLEDKIKRLELDEN